MCKLAAAKATLAQDGAFEDCERFKVSGLQLLAILPDTTECINAPLANVFWCSTMFVPAKNQQWWLVSRSLEGLANSSSSKVMSSIAHATFVSSN